MRTRDGAIDRSLASALALVMISLSVGACGPDASVSSTTRSSDQGFESARSVLLEFFVGLGSDEPKAVLHAMCDGQPETVSRLLRDYKMYVNENGLVRLAVESVDPSATVGSVEFELLIGEDRLPMSSTMTGVAGGDICLSSVDPVEREGVKVPIWPDS